MAPRHTPSPAPIGVWRAVAFSGVGGSGLIIVVIVAAWALFLVPQWMHRRAAAAQHLADRVEHAETDGDLVDVDIDTVGEGSEYQGSSASRGHRRVHGRRLLVRASVGDQAEPRRLGPWRLPRMPRRGPAGSSSAAVTGAASLPRTAASRRRRVLAVLASATLISALVVSVAAIAGLPVPAWLVAIPGGAMVAYLTLLAIVRPGDARRHPLPRPHLPEIGGHAHADDDGPDVDGRPRDGDRAHLVPVEAPGRGSSGESSREGQGGTRAGGDATWTPVPVPTPTYVTAPRARRTVRTIDLSDPGSWTAAGVGAVGASVLADDGEPTPTGVGAAAEEPAGPGWVEHRRAVGD
jgi:hypothetical protein